MARCAAGALWLFPAIASAASGSPAATALRVRLVDVTVESGVRSVNVCGERSKDYVVESLGTGACWFDYDADHDPDLFVPNGARRPDGGVPDGARASDALFRNDGGGRFTDVTRAAGLAESQGQPGSDWGIGCAAADVDGDGRLDLYVTQFGPNRLYRNRGDGRFEDVTARAGVGDPGMGAGAAFADADLDGDVDLYVANYVALDWKTARKRGCTFKGLQVYCGPKGLDEGRDVFYRNNGDATFSDATREAGFLPVPPGYGLGVAWTDFDNDGDPDLFVANDSTPNYLFVNDGRGRFREAGVAAGVAYNAEGREQASMGVDWGDHDNDGWFDLFVTNFSHDYSTLYRNQRDGTFNDVTFRAGLAEPTLMTLGWGTRFVDFDNDGWRDLFLANGHVFPETDQTDIGTSYAQVNQLFMSQGGARFVERTAEAGLTALPMRSWRGAAFADYDSDGDTDVFVVAIDDAAVLLRNDGGERGSWIGFDLRGRAPNTFALGARVTITAAGRRQMDEVRAGGTYAGQNDLRLLFGIGSPDRIERVEIRWPSGSRQTQTHLAARRYHRVEEPPIQKAAGANR